MACPLLLSALVTPPMARRAATVTPRGRSRYLPAFLDAVLPGLGHFVAGRRRSAAVFAIPVLALLLLFFLVLVFTPTIRLVAMAIDPAFLAALFALQTLLFGWRLIAVASSLFNPTLPRLSRRDAIPVALLVLVLVAPQAYAGIATNVAREVADTVVPITPTTSGAWAPPAAW